MHWQENLEVQSSVILTIMKSDALSREFFNIADGAVCQFGNPTCGNT